VIFKKCSIPFKLWNSDYYFEKFLRWENGVLHEASPRMSFHSFGVRWLCFGHWFRSTSTLSCRALTSTRLFVSVDLVFSFLFICVCFNFVIWRWRWVVALFHLCDLVWKILNLVFWIEYMGSLVMALFYWMHILIQHDWFYRDVAQKD